MKRIFVLVALIATFSLLLAAPVTETTARHTAELQIEISGRSEHSISTVYEMPNEAGETVAYVYNLDPVGFVIVSVDTDLPPVVGYSYQNDFITDDNQNTGYLFVQDDMNNRLAARNMTDEAILKANRMKWESYIAEDLESFNSRERSMYPPTGYSETEGWIDMLWDQSFPYNSYCPLDDVNGGRSVTGCVATALAMILNYHEYIGGASFSDADDYASNYEDLYCLIDNDYEENDFPDFPTLNSYLVDVQEELAGVMPLSDHVKAAINFAAGVSVRMKYSSVASGAFVFWSGHHDAREALLNKFGFDSAEGMSGSSPQFYNQLEEDMMNGRPAMFGILGGTEGHAILCDGWNSGEDTYHLNFGWSGYNNGWYSLPLGMPAGYNTIDNAVVNIEGGGTLFNLFALITNEDTSTPSNAEIEFRGTRLYEGNLDDGGSYSFDYMHEGTYQVSCTYENPDGGYFYKSQSFDLNDDNDFLMITLDDFTTLDGAVSGVSDPSGAIISYYNEEGELMTTGTADANGNYAIAGLMPGNYLATASWGATYYAEQQVEVTATQQTFDFALQDYSHTGTLSYYGTPGEVFHLTPITMTCAIRLAPEDLADYYDTAFSRVMFKSPIDQADGTMWAQVWAGNNLVSEKEITNYSYGQMLDIALDNFVAIEEGLEYYVGFKVQSTTGDLAWFDVEPRVEGKGAWFRINSWTEVNSNFNHNFVITAKVISLTADGEEIEITPAVTSLQQNYPNPFNPETNIAFSLAEEGNVTLEIYNVKGQKIKTLANGIYSAGDHILNWNGTNDASQSVSSGIYFYKMKNGRYTSTKKMILMK